MTTTNGRGAPLLSVDQLAVVYSTRYGDVYPIQDATMTVSRGETVGIVGESGSGKSVTCRAILGLVRREGGRVVEGHVTLDGKDLTQLSEGELSRDVRGKRISMVFQDPMRSLNPVRTIGSQLTETLQKVGGLSSVKAKERAAELLTAVRIPDVPRRLGQYPHQLSGGMRQRVAIALALAPDPDILIADEPTTALDVTVQAQVLQLLVSLQRDRDRSMILVTHDLGIIAATCEKVVVMYGGHTVEEGTVHEIFDRAKHPYTLALLSLRQTEKGGEKVERLGSIPGQPPSALSKLAGCPFTDRCDRVVSSCETQMPGWSNEGGHRWRCWNPA
jgi:oligopeptide/dipeptide ABC transporter ATP-binding protein